MLKFIWPDDGSRWKVKGLQLLHFILKGKCTCVPADSSWCFISHVAGFLFLYTNKKRIHKSGGVSQPLFFFFYWAYESCCHVTIIMVIYCDSISSVSLNVRHHLLWCFWDCYKLQIPDSSLYTHCRSWLAIVLNAQVYSLVYLYL